MWKLQGLCLWHMLKANLFEMFPRNWVLYVTTLCTRRTRLHYVIFTKMTLYIMLISCWSDKLLNVETLSINHCAGNSIASSFKDALWGLRHFLATESLLYILFISPEKLSPFSRDLHFCLNFLDWRQRGPIRSVLLVITGWLVMWFSEKRL